jgi:hypothetical protein
MDCEQVEGVRRRFLCDCFDVLHCRVSLRALCIKRSTQAKPDRSPSVIAHGSPQSGLDRHWARCRGAATVAITTSI